ncbi:MAG: hypothetical protein ACFFAF_18305 [Candidatus Hermodarchaeota archaeon]
MRARACIKCKEYLVINPTNPVNLHNERIFEKEHRGHTLITVDLSEIKGVFNKRKLSVEAPNL